MALRIAPTNVGGHVVSFAVSDSGIGIPEHQQGAIFGAFHQGERAADDEYSGTGLGLSISKSLAERLGGEIRVSSAPGSGSTFTLYLPSTFQPSP